MFSWFWKFLYTLTSSMFAIIDGIIDCAKILCGIDPITVNGKSSDFLTFIVSNEKVATGFKVAAILSISVVIFFAIVGIIRLVVKEKIDDTPARIIGRAVKSLVTFCFVPLFMFAFIWVLNVFASALYQGTLGDAEATMGKFLFGAFSADAVNPTVPIEEATTFFLRGDFDYKDVSQVQTYISLSEFDYFFAWISCLSLLWALARSILVFVERAFSIALLFIASPFSISASVIDDGQHFKLWRDQILTKFISGYGVLITLNVYIAIVSAISQNNVVLFPSSPFLNNLIKIGIIIGGALSMQQIMAVIGNLITVGGGSSEMAGAFQGTMGFRRLFERRRQPKAEGKDGKAKAGGKNEGTPGLTPVTALAGAGTEGKSLNGISGNGVSNNTFVGGSGITRADQKQVNDIIADRRDSFGNRASTNSIERLTGFSAAPKISIGANQSPLLENIISQNQAKIPTEERSSKADKK